MAPKKAVSEIIPDATKKDDKVVAKPKSASSKASPVPRKTPLHPSTMVMIKEAVKELDSRKGVSSQAIRGYITEKYPSVELIRLKYTMRRALTKGIESGVLVRPPNSTANGAQGRFRLAVRSKMKDPKLKTTENTDPNLEKAAKAGTKAKEKETNPEKKMSAPKKRSEAAKSKKPAKELSASKIVPAKKPKAKRPAEAKPKAKRPAKGDAEATPQTTEVKGAAKKGGKTKASLKSEEGNADAAPAAKTTVKRSKRAVAQ
ncbi:hypothetical protein UPYG_G00165310 [Umbra pygmaea]|uniref:H15 domain-containing protein n=1 Tax=Umbra pygmaea TaxID=75934 RepID=A0ABD0WMF5_UMBPY